MFFSSFITRSTRRYTESTEAGAGFVKRANWYWTLALAAIFLLTGCPMEESGHESTGFIPVGEWFFYDRYTITNDSIDYFMAGSEWEGIIYPDTILKGTIEKAVDFSKNSGVLIIKITEATYNTVGTYTGIYYSEYTNASIKLATAYADGSVEADTLSLALSLFTDGNMGNHVAMWGTYTK